MIKEKYKQRGTNEIIIINEEDCSINIGKDYYKISENMRIIKELYDYDKDIFKEIIEYLYIKYNFDMIEFLIKNKVTLKEIKKINEIILFPLKFPENDSMLNFKLGVYRMNIIDFFKYIYSQPYTRISQKFFLNYLLYISCLCDILHNKKYNKFPHNPFMAYKIMNYKIKRNNKKDIIKNIGTLHIEFYGTKNKYYITYNNKKYNLLNDEDRISLIKTYPRNIINNISEVYLSEYYPYKSIFYIIESFSDKEYYEKTINKNIFYLLKDKYKKFDKKTIEKIQRIILRQGRFINTEVMNFFTNDFKRNLYLLNIFNDEYLISSINEDILKYFLYNKNNKEKLRTIRFSFLTSKREKEEIRIENNIKIEEIFIIDLLKIINDDYLDKDIDYFFFNNIFLLTDEKTKEKIFICKEYKSEKKGIVKFIGKNYNNDFLERTKEVYKKI